MRIEEMTEEQRTKALARSERVGEIVADYEAEYKFTLAAPWPDTVAQLLLRGLGDPELHLIFQTLAQVEFAAGRLAEQPVDYAAFKD